MACNCPMESANAPSGLHLYEGETGVIAGGRPTWVNGFQALLELDTSKATVTVTYPGIDQWITIGPAPLSRVPSINRQQVALEKQILATINVTAGHGGSPHQLEGSVRVRKFGGYPREAETHLV